MLEPTPADVTLARELVPAFVDPRSLAERLTRFRVEAEITLLTRVLGVQYDGQDDLVSLLYQMREYRECVLRSDGRPATDPASLVSRGTVEPPEPEGRVLFRRPKGETSG